MIHLLVCLSRTIARTCPLDCSFARSLVLSSLVTVRDREFPRFFHTTLYDANLAYDSTSEANNAASGATRIALRFEYDYVGIEDEP